ncbi:MAG: DUF2794 domain-containing protein [Hyphomicrobiaceae bacterium]
MIPDAISITSSNGAVAARQSAQPPRASFTRQELNAILNVYGRKVASGEWRDYAIDLGREKATFSVFRRTSEMPLYRIEKQPKLARKQGAYSIVSQTGLVLKRGHDLERVLGAIDKRIRVVD